MLKKAPSVVEDINEKFLEESKTQLENVKKLNKMVNKKIIFINNMVFLLAALIIMSASFFLEHSFEQHKAELANFFSYDNKEAFWLNEQPFLIGASNELSIETLTSVTKIEDVRAMQRPEFIKDFGENTETVLNIVALTTFLSFIVLAFLDGHFRKFVVPFYVVNLKNKDNYIKEKIGGYNGSADIIIMFAVSCFSLLLSMVFIEEESRDLLNYSTYTFSSNTSILNVFTIVLVAFIILKTLAFRTPKIKTKKSISELSFECQNRNEMLEKTESEIKSDVDSLLILNEALEKHQSDKVKQSIIRRVILNVKTEIEEKRRLVEEIQKNKEVISKINLIEHSK